ncbi:MAG: RagB/SusD family nutrient uptake outer membrane protein [Cyclobacteriaceae bacterium]|nr:RagB/SusD family nutrient uptake outer membrane protein [Cyclobacteriaceae bacterium]
MKNIKIIVILSFVISLIASCDIGRLDTPPLAVSEGDYFQNEVEFRRAVVSAYAKMTDWYWFKSADFIHHLYYLAGDDITTNRDGTATYELFNGNLNPTEGKSSYFWDMTYEMIQRTNVIIEKAETADLDMFDSPELINYMKGEALFLRSLAYFKLFNMYGRAPLVITRITNREDTNTPASEGVQLLDQVIEDLEEAASLLPASWPSEEAGRAVSNSAKGLLVKALVYRGDYSGSSTDYATAANVYSQISGANLETDYSNNFSAFHENNSESLFEFQAAAPSPEQQNPWLSNDGPWRGVESMHAFWGMYKTFGPQNDMIGGETWKVTRKLFNQFGTDPRLAFFMQPDRSFEKYGKDGLDALLPTFAPSSVNNVRILRLADVKLVAAEAILKSGGNKASAIALINEIRTRARDWGLSSGAGDGIAPADHPTSETDSGVILQWIMDERFVELCGEEGIRWHDLKRWDAHGDISLQNWNGSDEHFSTDLSASFQFEYPKTFCIPFLR